jgi:GntR family histidine utilization transcriptional repressor
MSQGNAPKLYEQVKNHLLEGIAAGTWREGERIPSEHELMATLGASRMTVHRALRELSADGYLVRMQGIGSFVAKPAPRSALLEIFDIADDITGRGHTHSAQILTLEAIKADAALAAMFAIRRGAKLFRSEIIHRENSLPVQIEERLVSPAFAPAYLAQDFSALTTSRYLASLAPPAEVEHIVHAITPEPRIQALLSIPPLEPCLRVTRRTWTASGPATLSTLTHPGSRYSLGSRYDPSHMKKSPVNISAQAL